MKLDRDFSWQLWLDVAQQAWLSLGDRRLRTMLSIAGIAVGIAAVTLIGVVTQGGKQVVFSELQTFGLRTVWIVRDRRLVDPHHVARIGTGIDSDDWVALRESKCCKAMVRLTPVVLAGREGPSLASAGRQYSRVRVEGVGEDYLAINNDVVAGGRAFTADDIDRARRVIMIGEQVRIDLFGPRSNPIGAEVRLGVDKFEVVGVLAAKDRSLLSSIGSAGGQDANGRVLIPYRRMQLMNNSNQIDILQGEVDPGWNAGEASAHVTKFLERRHAGAFSYRVDTMEQYVQTANKILGGVSTIGIVAASVSLIVAGLGILNIMSTSVLERTREIGLRKALGGTETEILMQFLLEAGLISLLGGMVGLVLGGGSSLLITRLTGFPLLPSLPLIVVALAVSVVVGLMSGLYPAWRAAQLRPVDALRYE